MHQDPTRVTSLSRDATLPCGLRPMVAGTFNNYVIHGRGLFRLPHTEKKEF